MQFSHLLEGDDANTADTVQTKRGVTHGKQLLWEQKNDRRGKGKGHIRTGKKTISHKRDRMRKRRQ